MPTITPPTPFTFPKAYNFPPQWSLQPTLSTRDAQFRRWSRIILLYCQYHRLWRLTLVDALETPLFHNAELRKRMTLTEARTILEWMASPEGEQRAEWVEKEGLKGTAWIYWKRPEEWAEVIAKWVAFNDPCNTNYRVLTNNRFQRLVRRTLS